MSTDVCLPEGGGGPNSAVTEIRKHPRERRVVASLLPENLELSANVILPTGGPAGLALVNR